MDDQAGTQDALRLELVMQLNCLLFVSLSEYVVYVRVCLNEAIVK